MSHRVAGPANVGGHPWNSVAGNYSRSIIRATGVSDITSAILISGWTRLSFSMVRGCQRQRWLRHYRKLTKQRRIRSHRWNTLLDSRVTKYITCRLKNSSIHLRFRCRHSKTGCTMSGISTSFHSHWIVNNPRNVPKRIEKLAGPMSCGYSRKT